MNDMSEKEKMLSEQIYDVSDPELTILRKNAHMLCQKYNLLFENETDKRTKILDSLLPNKGKNAYLQGPIYFDYGVFTEIGKNFYSNFNLTILDCAKVIIGNNVLIGPNVSIVTPIHPLRYQERNFRTKKDGSLYNYEYAKPISIGDNCWIASNVTIIGGVQIGNGCVIGAGSVVSKSIPDFSLAVGNPCTPIRKITDKDIIDIPKI